MSQYYSPGARRISNKNGLLHFLLTRTLPVLNQRNIDMATIAVKGRTFTIQQARDLVELDPGRVIAACRDTQTKSDDLPPLELCDESIKVCLDC